MNISQAMGPYMDLELSPQWVSMLRHIVRFPLKTASAASSTGVGKVAGVQLFGAPIITEESDIVYQVRGLIDTTLINA